MEWISRADDNFPQPLWALGLDTPSVLYAEPDFEALTPLLERSVGIVGTRQASAYGETVAMELASAFVAEGFSVVTGGALGIDSAALRGTLSSRGKPIVVMPCGLDRVYPPENESLLSQVMPAGGVLLSEYPPGTLPSRERFLSRDRITAALPHALIAVEGMVDSGTGVTVRWARQVHRMVLAVPGPITSQVSHGPNVWLSLPDVKPVTTVQSAVTEVVRYVERGW